MTEQILENKVIWTNKTGQELVRDRLANKGTAFTKEERDEFGLCGFFPESVLTLDEQIQNVYEEFSRYGEDELGKYNYLFYLRNRNLTLFFSFVMSYPVESIPIIYTPTVGKACLRFSRAFRFPDGLFISQENIDKFEYMLHHLQYFDVKAPNIVVATDGEGILGLGDLGIDGMGIPIGKLSLYIAGSGIYPYRTLPITLDVGTNSQRLLLDKHYKGIRQPRLNDDEYYLFLEEFIVTFKKYLPNSILQFEDFSKQRAITLLNKYQDRLPCFNDDIQGTGAVVLAGLYNAMKIRGTKLKDQKFVLYGYGAGGYGVARQIYYGLMLEGLSEEEAKSRIFTLDSRGLITTDRDFDKDPYKKMFAKDIKLVKNWEIEKGSKIDLNDTLKNTKAEVLLGLSTQKDTFTHSIVQTMLQYTKRPVIFPLSNPTDNAEAHPQTLYEWTNGGAIVATGSPFPDVVYKDKRYVIGQGNNLFVFPGLGLGALTVAAKKITPEMLNISAKTVASCVDKGTLNKNCVYPPITEFRKVCLKVAGKVAEYALNNNLAKKEISGDIYKEIEKNAWNPLEGYFKLKKI